MMDSKWILIVGLGVALVGSVVSEWKRHRSLLRYWSRLCVGPVWRRRFPAVSKSEIRAFLNLFVDAFGFSRKRRLCFSPDDRVADIYQACYSPDAMSMMGGSDCLELETLVADMQNVYNLDVLPHWREDVTLGDLFMLVQAVKENGKVDKRSKSETRG